MGKRFLYLFFYLTIAQAVCWWPANAQSPVSVYADSLLSIARKATTTEGKIEGLLNVSFFWSDRDTAQAYQYLGEAKTWMDKKPSDYYSGLYHQFLGNILMEYAYEDAKASFQEADRYFDKLTTQQVYLNRSKIWNNYAVVLQRQDRSEAYLEITINKALPFARLAGDSASVAYQLNNIARQLENVQDYQKAEHYYKEAINTLANLRHATDNKLEVFTNAARNALYQRDFNEVRIFLDSAHVYAKQIPHSTYLPYLYRTEGVYYRLLKQKDKSLASFQKAVEAAHQTNDEYALQDIYHQVSLAYKAFGDYPQAKEYLQRAMANHPFDILHNRLMYQRELAQLEFLLGNYQDAFLQMEAFANGLDSIHSREEGLKVRELEAKYKSIERENEILKLEDDNRKKELALARSQWWQLMAITGFLLAACVAFFSWRLYKSKQGALEHKEQLHQKELKSIKQQQRLQQYDSMLQGQEQERNRLAKDLHDGLGGLLAGVKLKLSSIVSKKSSDITLKNGAMKDVIAQLDYSVDELRRISRNMMPEALLSMGLNAALGDLCRLLSTERMAIKFEPLDLQSYYSKPLLIAVYRIIQELLTNAIKHADASEVILQCSELEGWLFITVEDNGKGMEIPGRTPHNGIGLENITNRVVLLNGKIEFVSNPGEGTTVNIQVPVS